MNILFEAPLNQVSFGNVTYNILKVLFKKVQQDPSFKVSYFPIGNVELSAFDKMPKDFALWVKSLVDNRFSNLSKDAVTLKLWHINGAEKRVTSRQALLTFYELDQPTVAEKAIVGLQDLALFSSSYAANSFAELGCKNVHSIPMGFDPDFGPTGKKYLEGKINFLIMGKFEKRKHTDKIIRMWAKYYGNNPKYQLTCCIINPFLPKDFTQKMLASYRQMAGNINILPFVATNSEVNDIINSADIDLSGLSGAEGWGLPAFNATCLGKWSIVLNATSHKDWATKENALLVEPSAKIEAYDGVFFKKGSEFNQGFIHDFNEDHAIAAIEKAIFFTENKIVNQEGIKLGQKFTYENTVEKICDTLRTI
jgi:glycosyltransferase involved in cell wall biosynthesis